MIAGAIILVQQAVRVSNARRAAYYARAARTVECVAVDDVNVNHVLERPADFLDQFRLVSGPRASRATTIQAIGITGFGCSLNDTQEHVIPETVILIQQAIREWRSGRTIDNEGSTWSIELMAIYDIDTYDVLQAFSDL